MTPLLHPLFAVDIDLARPVGQQSFDQKSTTIINMDNQTILKVNLEDLPVDQKVLTEQATEEFREKCLLSYSRTRDSVVQKTPLPSVLLHGQSEDVEVRTIAHLVHKIVHESFTNHNKVLANMIGNVMKEDLFGAPVDQVGPAYSNGLNPSAVGSNIPGTSQQPNGGQFQQPPVQ
jgi:hypothetical protein